MKIELSFTNTAASNGVDFTALLTDPKPGVIKSGYELTMSDEQAVYNMAGSANRENVLAHVSQQTGVPIETLRELNPQLTNEAAQSRRLMGLQVFIPAKEGTFKPGAGWKGGEVEANLDGTFMGDLIKGAYNN